MCTRHTDAILAQLAAAEARAQALERDNRHLRALLSLREEQFRDLDPGYYLVTQSLEFNGPGQTRAEAERSVRDYTADGGWCSLVHVIRHYEADEQPDDNEGIYHPATLFPGPREAA